MAQWRGTGFGSGRRLRFEQLESRKLLSITINSNEIWDGVSNPHAADGVMLVAGAYTILTDITIGAGVTVFLDDPAPFTGDPASNSISWTFAPGAGGLTFVNSTSTIDVSRGSRGLSPSATFTINMNDNPIGGAVAGAGRIINGPFVVGGGVTGDTMSVIINSQTDVVLGAIDIRLNDAASGAITVHSQGLVDIKKLANADVSAGGGSTRAVNITGETLVLGDIDTRAFRVEAGVGDINLRALRQLANSVYYGSGNSATVNTITLNGAVNTNGPPVTIQPGGSLNLTAAKVILAASFSANLSENGDSSITVGTTGNGFTTNDVFVNGPSFMPDLLSFTVLHDVSPPKLVGDANSDGIVDAADYVVWRKTQGSQSDLRADFDHSSTVDSADYGLWRANFGKVTPPLDPPDSVTRYGATPNDSTFDEAAIQAAINANASVYVPPGEYWLNSKLVVPAGRTLYGPTSGPPAVLRVRFDTGVNANNYAIEITGNDVVIQNLTIDKDFIDGSYGVGIFADNRSNITISRVEIRDYSVRYGIHLIECNNFRISDCYIHDFMMNQSNPSGNEADMIQDSPAGIRITRSTAGFISDSRVHNIEVGPNGRASISELIPGYGPQGYQADCITLSDSSGITVEDNDLWNSGELVDILVSDNCTVRNNVMQMAFLFVVKCIGSQNCIVKDNYLADGAIGVILVDHSNGDQCTGNLIDGNDIANCGSRGVWDIAASSRLGYAISGIYIDNNASGNTVTNNNIYNYYNYLPLYVRQGTGTNTVSNNASITTEFGPGGGGDAVVLGGWTEGLTHSKELIALNRALVFFTYAEDDSANISASAVTYGGRSLSKITEQLTTEGARRVYVSAWMLRQDAINTATSENFNVTWNSTPDSTGYASVFLANIYQTTPLYSWDSIGVTSGNTITANPRVTHDGDIALYAATAAEEGDFTPNNGFNESLEVAISGADGTAGYKLATGDQETASVTHTNLETGSLASIVFRKNPAVVFGGTTVNITELGAFANDGVNDAIILQNALNNSAYKEIYLPPGVYHFDRSISVPSNKSVRGDNYATTEIRTLADITPFRLDGVTGAKISDLTITRPQTQDSDNEIIRGDYSSFVTIDSIRAVNAGSRAPIINMQYGNDNRVTRCSIYDYQVIRSEPNPSNPNEDHLQVFGSGITFTGETNITISDCKVVQNNYLTVPLQDIKGWHQSSAIQVPICVGGTIERNYIYQTGQGIDTSGGSNLIIADNFIEQIHSAGIKLVNGSNNNVVENNYLRNCGLTGIWVSVGVSGNGGSYENIVRNNTLVGIGKGIGFDFWNFSSTPAAINLQAAQIITDRVRDNIIRSNRSYDNNEQRGVVVADPGQSSNPYAPANNTITDNIAEFGVAPAPPALGGFLD